MPKMVVLGEALVDLFAEPGVELAAATSFRPSPGGAPANVAVALARLGADVDFVGKVGADAFGRLLRATLDRHGVDTRHLLEDARAPTMLAVVASPRPDAPQFVLYNGANALLEAAELPRAAIEASAVFVYGSVTLAGASRGAALAAARLARRAGSHVLFDVNLRPALWPDLAEARERIEAALASAAIVKLNEDELEFLTGTRDAESGSRQVLERGPQLCCVSAGARGASFATGAWFGQVPAFAVEAVDGTGCGDAFVAGLALGVAGLEREVGQLGREELQTMVHFANACGAIVATQEGAMSAELTPAAVTELLQRRGVPR